MALLSIISAVGDGITNLVSNHRRKEGEYRQWRYESAKRDFEYRRDNARRLALENANKAYMEAERARIDEQTRLFRESGGRVVTNIPSRAYDIFEEICAEGEREVSKIEEEWRLRVESGEFR